MPYEWEILSGIVGLICAVISLFVMIYKPINGVTKAITELTLKVDHLSTNIEENNKDFSAYREHVSESQKKQWDVINKHSEILIEHGIELKQLREKIEEIG